MAKIECLDSGLVYKNPIPHVRSVHGYFPSVVSMDNGQMLATFSLGEAFESADNHVHICRSTDGGKSWQLEGRICEGTRDRLTCDYGRLTYLGGGRLVVYMMRSDRTEHPDDGLTNAATLGFVPTELLLLRSEDYGQSWSEPELIEPPLEGPSFEMCSGVFVLSDGRWVISTQTWPGWDGDCPNGIRMIGLVSQDEGRSWDYMDVMHEKGAVYFWESKIVELKDGRLLAVAWVYDDDAKHDRPNHFAVSGDGGQSWSAPRSMGLIGQTLTPYVLEDGRVFCVYRRIDKPGLWAAVCRLDGDDWRTDLQVPLWGHNAAGLTSSSEDMSHNFNVLRFGAPSITRSRSGELFVVFWCYEDCVSVIRWFKLAVG